MLLSEGWPFDAATTQDAPWYAVPLVAGGFLLIGALIAFLSGALTKRSEIRAADRRHWNDRILEACALIQETGYEVYFEAREIEPDLERYREGLRPFRTKVEAANAKRWELEFIASDKLAAAASAIIAKTNALISGETPSARMSAGVELSGHLNEFTGLVRDELRAGR